MFPTPHLSRSPGTGDGKPDDVATFDAAGHSVHLPAIRRQSRPELCPTVKPGVEFLEKFLRHSAVSLQPEDDHAEVSTGRDLKPRVRPHQGLKLPRQANIFPDHVLEARDAVVPQYKPELQSSEPLTQGNLPVLGDNKIPELY